MKESSVGMSPLSLNIVAIYLDPSNFNHIETGPIVAQQMRQVFAQYGDLSVVPASNDRIAGWQACKGNTIPASLLPVSS